VALAPGQDLEAIRGDVQDIIERELANIYAFTRRLASGEFRVC